MVSQLHTRKAKNKDTQSTTGTWSYTNVHIQTWKFTIIVRVCVWRGGGSKKKKLTGWGGGGGGFSLKKKGVVGRIVSRKRKKLDL